MANPLNDIIKSLLGPSTQKQPLAKQRIVPSQPLGVPRDKIFVGSDIGFVSYTGQKPRPGDMIIITGLGARVMASTGQSGRPLTNPIFSPAACKCKCPARGSGAAFLLSYAMRVNIILVIDVSNNQILQMLSQPDVWLGRGIAIDQSSQDLYVLDDNRELTTPKVEGGTQTREYFNLVKFVISGDQYIKSSIHELSDPLPTAIATPSNIGSLMTDPDFDADPPSFRTNCLSIIGGIPHITLHKPPTRYIVFSENSFQTINITKDGSNIDKGLRGNIITVPDKPAKSSSKFVIACDSDETNFILYEINSSNEVVREIDLSDLEFARQLASVCNNLVILNSNRATAVPGFFEFPPATNVEKIHFIDFCKKFSILKKFDPEEPLDNLDALGIASFGCFPLYGHLRDSGGFILSQIRQSSGGDISGLFESEFNQSDLHPQASGIIAGRRGQSDIDGNVALPFPVSLPDFEVKVSADAVVLRHIDGSTLITGNDDYLKFSSNNIKFSASFGLTRDLIFNSNRREGILINVFTRPKNYHTYNQQLVAPYITNNHPVSMLFDQFSSDYFITSNSIGNTVGADELTPPATVKIAFWDTTPILKTTNGDVQLPTNSNEQGGTFPLVRKYTHYDLGNFTMPAFDTPLSLLDLNIPKSNFRGFMMIYGTSRVTNIDVAEGTLKASGLVSLPTLRLTDTEFPGHTFTQFWEFELTGKELSYNITVTGIPGSPISGSRTIELENVTEPRLLLGPDPEGVKIFEGWADIFPTGLPDPP